MNISLAPGRARRALLLWGLFLLGAGGCADVRPKSAPPPGGVMTGIDVLEAEGFKPLQGLRIGLITNHSGRDSRGRLTAEILAQAPGVSLNAVFSPEHGFLGRAEAGESVGSSTVRVGGRDVPLFSLYSGSLAGMRPRPEDLADLDVLVFDMQDIGTRFYTYLTTMGMALEEAAKAGLPFMVLDRPDPINGTTIEGPLLTDMGLRKATAVAYFPVPIRHGLTAGEMARLHNASVRHPGLRVVKMRGWSRDMWYDQTGLPWTPPSPNMPDLAAAALYPGTGLFEASNLSVGRGTPHPFTWLGAPWLDAPRLARAMNDALLDGAAFTVQEYTPAKAPFSGESCPGIRISVTDRDTLRPLAVFRKLSQALRQLHPQEFRWQWDVLRNMTGTTELQRIYERDADPVKILDLFNRDVEGFEKSRRPFLLY